jgi:hypothetical protein
MHLRRCNARGKFKSATKDKIWAFFKKTRDDAGNVAIDMRALFMIVAQKSEEFRRIAAKCELCLPVFGTRSSGNKSHWLTATN